MSGFNVITAVCVCVCINDNIYLCLSSHLDQLINTFYWWNKCLSVRGVCKTEKVCVCVYFAWVSPAPSRAVAAAVLCVSVLADDTVALLWVYCEAFITPAEPVDTQEQIYWAFALCFRHILQPETCVLFIKQMFHPTLELRLSEDTCEHLCGAAGVHADIWVVGLE